MWSEIKFSEKVLQNLVEQFVMGQNVGEKVTLLDVGSVIKELEDGYTAISGDDPPNESWKLRLQDRPAAIRG